MNEETRKKLLEIYNKDIADTEKRVYSQKMNEKYAELWHDYACHSLSVLADGDVSVTDIEKWIGDIADKMLAEYKKRWEIK